VPQNKRKSPILIIDVVKVDNQFSKIRLIRPGFYNSEIVEIPYGDTNIAEYIQRYHEALKNFKRKVDRESLKQNIGILNEAFREMFKHNRYLYSKFFKDVDKGPNGITNYLRKHIPRSSSMSNSDIGIIEIRADSIKHIFPLESLVMVDTPEEIKGKEDVAKVASGILGFSFIINRVRKGSRQSQKREFNNIPKLPLKYFYDKSLKGTKVELDFFKDEIYKKYFVLDGPWPEEDVKSIEKELVRYLCQPEIGFYCVDQPDMIQRQIDEIHHFSCHSYTNEENSWKSGLRLTNNFHITIETMQEHLPLLLHEKFLESQNDPLVKNISRKIWRFWSKKLNQADREMPLIFFNACGSAELSPKGITSFPEYFLYDNQNCGFIGSEIEVPDAFAAEFSKQFYLHLLRGYGVGEAIFGARRNLLNWYNNPLGILYTFYADPYLRVKKAVTDI